MTERNQTCSNCKWFKPTSDSQFMRGGWCGWRAPMIFRQLLWGAHNERIREPEKEWCAVHQGADGVVFVTLGERVAEERK